MDAGSPPASDLLEAMIQELIPLYGRIDLPGLPTAGPSDFAPPRGTFLVGYRDGTPVCCGGVKPLPDGACEIKRMFVTPESRGSGVATALLAALEDAARELGYRVVRLDTGPKQPQAERMYRRAGYREIAMFNGNTIASFFGEKDL